MTAAEVRVHNPCTGTTHLAVPSWVVTAAPDRFPPPAPGAAIRTNDGTHAQP